MNYHSVPIWGETWSSLRFAARRVKDSTWALDALRKRINEIPLKGLPLMPEGPVYNMPRHNLNVPNDLWDLAVMEADETIFSPSSLVRACIVEVVAEGVKVSLKERDEEKTAAYAISVEDGTHAEMLPRVLGMSCFDPPITSRAIPNRRTEKQPWTSKAVKDWQEGINQRLVTTEIDSLAGRWARWYIIGGEMSVDRYRPLNEQGLRDFDTEKQDGRVVVEKTSWPYNEDEARAWVEARNREGRAMTWVYITGDCESIWKGQEARRREAQRAAPHLINTLEDLAKQERKEAIELSVWGRAPMYVEWAALDVLDLLAIAKRDKIPLQKAIPANLAHIVRDSVKLGWKFDTETRRALIGQSGALTLLGAIPPPLGT